MLSVFVANVVNLISVDSSTFNNTPLYKKSDGSAHRWPEPKRYEIGDSSEHLMWFLQVLFFSHGIWSYLIISVINIFMNFCR